VKHERVSEEKSKAGQAKQNKISKKKDWTTHSE
jgi:hypothetical protein